MVKIIFNYHLYLDAIIEGRKGLNPFMDYFNITISDVSPGKVIFKMPIRPEFLHPANTPVVSANEAIAHAMMTMLNPDEGLTTIELKSNFLSGVDRGELVAEATVFKKGQILMIGDCLVRNDEGKNVCRVSATFMLLKK